MNYPDTLPLNNVSSHYQQAVVEIKNAFHSDDWNDDINESYEAFIKQLAEVSEELAEIVNKTTENIETGLSLEVDDKIQASQSLCEEAEAL